MTLIYVVSLLTLCIFSSSPGVQIGITTYVPRENGSFGQRLRLDDNGNIHVTWMWCGGAYPGTRYCAWNFRFFDGSWYGETQGSPSVSGYVQLDVVRDANPDNQVSAIAYHYDPGAGYFGWVDTDAGQGWGLWPNNMVTPAVNNHIWPRLAWTENGNIIMPTGDYDVDIHHLYVSTDLGASWTHVNQWDSCRTLSHFARTSHNSNKVVFAHTRFITDTIGAGQLNNDVWLMLSIDGGFTWGPHINITDYQPYPTDSVRAYCDVNAIFDNNGNLHVAWAGRKVTDTYHDASKIWHWDDASNQITAVNSPSIYYSNPGGWWIEPDSGGDYGGRLPADQPQLVVDETTGDLYCLWHGNDDYFDHSSRGYINMELYGSKSTDGGLTWSDYKNLTNTRTPNQPPGWCDSEDFMTANPFTMNDSIYVTFIEDKDPGPDTTWPTIITHPVRCWVFHKDLISGAREAESVESVYSKPMLEVFPNPFIKQTDIICMMQDSRCRIQDFSLKIFDATGQLVKDLSHSMLGALRPTVITWQGDEPSGVYFIELVTEDRLFSEKIVKLK